jgi:peptide deformylase
MKQATQNPTRKEIQHGCAAVNTRWNEVERHKRRRITAIRQQWLLNALVSSSTPVAARVA